MPTCREGGVPLGSCAPWYVVRAQRCCVCDPKPALEQLACWVMLLSVNLQGLSVLIRKKTTFLVFLSLDPLAVQNLVSLAEICLQHQSL